MRYGMEQNMPVRYTAYNVLFMATTGKAAGNIQKSTAHSFSKGGCLPVKPMKFKELRGGVSQAPS
jgi:hypothetical protein